MPTELGFVVSDLLTESFPDLMDVKYTARLEEELDEIEDGKLNWVDALREFSTHFGKRLKTAETSMRNVKQEAIPTDETCDKCGKPMVIRWGKFGRFMACSGYPECKNTKELDKPGEEGSSEEEEEAPTCDKCGKPFAKKRGRFGMFWACTGYPDCKNTMRIAKEGQPPAKPPEPLDEECPRCGKNLVRRSGRYGPFVSCSGYPGCKYVQGTDTGVKCIRKGCEGWLVRKRSRRGAFFGCDQYPKCRETFPGRPISRECPECKRPFLLVRTAKGSTDPEELFCSDKECGHKEPVPEDIVAALSEE